MLGFSTNRAKDNTLAEQWMVGTIYLHFKHYGALFTIATYVQKTSDQHHHDHLGTYLAYADWMVAPHFARNSSSSSSVRQS